MEQIESITREENVDYSENAAQQRLARLPLMERHRGFFAQKKSHARSRCALPWGAINKSNFRKVNMTTMNRTIYITQADMTRLRSLIESLKSSREDIKDLRAELDHARVVAPAQIPPDVITMNSKAQLRDLSDGEIMTYTPVFPARANVDDGLISILAPIGTAMLGHRVGDEFEWHVPAGPVRLRVESVLYQPEAAGHYHL